MSKYDFKKKMSLKKCEHFVNEYHDDLVTLVKLYRGEAKIVSDEKEFTVSNPVAEPEDPKEVDPSCVGAVLAMISRLTGKCEVQADSETLYHLAQCLRITMTLDKFVGMGLLTRKGKGYTMSKEQAESGRKLIKEMNE